jgi:hypothetical protein
VFPLPICRISSEGCSGTNRSKPLSTSKDATARPAWLSKAKIFQELFLTIDQRPGRNHARGYSDGCGMRQVYAAQLVARGIQVRLHAPQA